MVADDDGRYVVANQAAEDLFGVATGTFSGRRMACAASFAVIEVHSEQRVEMALATTAVVAPLVSDRPDWAPRHRLSRVGSVPTC